jgi:urocanate hydratase
MTSAFELIPLDGATLKRNIQSREIQVQVVGEQTHCEASDSGFHPQVLSIQAAATFEAR